MTFDEIMEQADAISIAKSHGAKVDEQKCAEEFAVSLANLINPEVLGIEKATQFIETTLDDGFRFSDKTNPNHPIKSTIMYDFVETNKIQKDDNIGRTR